MIVSILYRKKEDGTLHGVLWALIAWWRILSSCFPVLPALKFFPFPTLALLHQLAFPIILRSFEFILSLPKNWNGHGKLLWLYGLRGFLEWPEIEIHRNNPFTHARNLCQRDKRTGRTIPTVEAVSTGTILASPRHSRHSHVASRKRCK